VNHSGLDHVVRDPGLSAVVEVGLTWQDRKGRRFSDHGFFGLMMAVEARICRRYPTPAEETPAVPAPVKST
jgi:hypothetical protein